MISKIIEKGIIEPAELHELLNDDLAPSIKVVDGTFTLPGAAEEPYQIYLRKRIDHAQFFDIKGIADHACDIPNMLPNAESFSVALSNMGISNDDIVVVYGQAGMIMGPCRVWWSFRAFGHDKVCVLNGGMPAWINEGYELNTALPPPPPHTDFSAKLNPALVRNIEDMKALSANPDSGTKIFDARPSDRFSGQTPEPRPGMRSGHIPGSQNIPCVNLIDPTTGKFKLKDELHTIFDNIGFKSGMPVVTTCGSGVTACVIALALFTLGEKNTPVYDGSWSEWGHESTNTPIKTTSS